MSEVDVLKFGGSTFTDTADHVALAAVLRDRCRRTSRRLVVIASALAGETEALRARLLSVCPDPPDTSRDGLLPIADTIGAHLLSAALLGAGVPVACVAGSDVGFLAAQPLGLGRLDAIHGRALRDLLDKVDIVVLPGGQAANALGHPVWLGKNSSDVSAVAAAAAVGAERCELYSDVDGVYSCDPHAVPESRRFAALSYSDAAVLATFGAKVLHREAISTAAAHGVEIRCYANRPPYGFGSTIGPTGDELNAVVLNTRSEARRFEDDATSRIVAEALADVGINAFVHASLGHNLVVVVGGYVDVGAGLRARGFPAGDPVGIPVVDIVGGTARIELVPDEERAVQRARQLHQKHIT